MRIIEYKVGTEWNGTSVSSYLKQKKYPEKALAKLRKEDGLIKCNGDVIHMNYRFNSDREESLLEVMLIDEKSNENIIPVEMDIEIVFEDEDIIIINKRAGMPIHPSLNNQNNTLANALMHYYKSKGEKIKFRCINRLDKDTTGLTIIAKNYLAAGILSEDIALRKIEREYVAIVNGVDLDDEGTIDYPIGRLNQSMIERCVDFENGEKAVTHYFVEKRYYEKNISIVRLKLETGRTHQIRVHMKSIGHPLVGDYIYNPEDTRMNRQALHARRLCFIHPITGKKMEFETDMPNDMKKLLEKSV